MKWMPVRPEQIRFFTGSRGRERRVDVFRPMFPWMAIVVFVFVLATAGMTARSEEDPNSETSRRERLNTFIETNRNRFGRETIVNTDVHPWVVFVEKGMDSDGFVPELKADLALLKKGLLTFSGDAITEASLENALLPVYVFGSVADESASGRFARRTGSGTSPAARFIRNDENEGWVFLYETDREAAPAFSQLTGGQIHEFVHQVLQNLKAEGDRENKPRFWVDDGLATLFEGMKWKEKSGPDGDRLSFEVPDPEYVKWLEAGHREKPNRQFLPFDQMYSITTETFLQRVLRRTYNHNTGVAQAWSIHYLVPSLPDRFQKSYRAFLSAYLHGEETAEDQSGPDRAFHRAWKQRVAEFVEEYNRGSEGDE